MKKSNKKIKKNIYNHTIDLVRLKIKNKPRDEFRKILEQIKYRGYEVEQLQDGRKIVITKPGGKFVFGAVRREDFMVWIYTPKNDSLWLISHKNIYEDLEEKGRKNPAQAVKIITALQKVCDGEDLDNIMAKVKLINPCGEPPELLLKVYKWIWGQEDCNYPKGEGRNMSMKAIVELKNKFAQKI